MGGESITPRRQTPMSDEGDKLVHAFIDAYETEM